MPAFKTFARALACAAALAAVSRAAVAQTWPDRPVKIIVAVSAGGSIDTLTRILADKLAEKWGQGVIVENRPGGAGNIGAMAAARAAPDGYTLHMAGQSLTANVTNTPDTAPSPNEFEPIVMVSLAQDILMVGRNSPIKSVADLIGAAKAKPKQLTYGSLGPASSAHLATVQFSELTGIRAEHVPYSNFGQMQTDVVAGRLSFWLATIGGVLGAIKGGDIRPLAVSGDVRASELPDVPTFKEQGVNLVEPSSWYAVVAPKSTRADIVAKVNADVNAILGDAALRARLSALGYLLRNGTPGELAAFFRADVARWKALFESPLMKEQ